MGTTGNRFFWLFSITGGVVLLDQITKGIVHSRFLFHETLPLLPFLSLTYIRNKGAAFGLLSSAPDRFRDLLFVGISLIAVVLLVLLYLRSEGGGHRLRRISLSLVLGGAVGNLIDRLRMGEVIDFIDLHWGRYHWPAFNAADSAITVGVILLLLHLAFEESKT